MAGRPAVAAIVILAMLPIEASVQSAAEPLRLVFACQQKPSLKFRFSVQNVSTTGTAAVIGYILANDRKFVPQRLELTVRRPGLADTTLQYNDWSIGVIAGRIDPWVISLPAGASYSVIVPARDFRTSETFAQEAFSVPAQLQLHLTTGKIGSVNLDMQHLRSIEVWEGVLTSDWIRFPEACQ